MEIVKYTREQYREEFLKSEEWRIFRAKVLTLYPNCCKCNLPATDIHHILYPIDIHILNKRFVLTVCRNCHDLIHQAIDLNLLPHPSHSKLGLYKIRIKTLNFNFSVIENLKKETYIDESLYHKIRFSPIMAQLRIKGVLKRTNLNNCNGIKISVEKYNKIQLILKQQSDPKFVKIQKERIYHNRSFSHKKEGFTFNIVLLKYLKNVLLPTLMKFC